VLIAAEPPAAHAGVPSTSTSIFVDAGSDAKNCW